MRKFKFSKISKEMVKQAIFRFNAMSEDERKRYGQLSRTYFLIHNGQKFPPKMLIRIALNKTTKELEKENFDFNAIEAQTYLASLGFKIEGNREPRNTVENSQTVPHTSTPSQSKTSAAQPQTSSTTDDKIENDNDKYHEAQKYERLALKTGRNPHVVRKIKAKKEYTCEVCNFNYNKRIVEAHHLTPLSKSDGEQEVSPKDLIVLCPNCHALAHYLLKEDNKYEQRNELINGIKNILKNL